MKNYKSKNGYWDSIYALMRKQEFNKFVYKDWFTQDGRLNFIKDLGEYPSCKHVLCKIDESAPFSPDNYKWVKRVKRCSLHKVYKHKTIRNCQTIVFYIGEDVNQNLGGIYKLLFSDGSFYIGSTKRFITRISCWTAAFNGTSRNHNKKLLLALSKSDSCIFSVLEYMDVLEKDAIEAKETEYILQHKHDDKLLNRSHDASSNKGIKWTDEEKRTIKETLVNKYKNSAIKPARTGRPRLDASRLFKSKCFGDKE